MNCAKKDTPIYYVDPRPSISSKDKITVIKDVASTGVAKAIELIKELK